MIFQFTICIVVNIIFNIVIREKPDTPPSAVSEVVYEQLTCKLVLKILRENLNFLALCIAYALLAGSFLAIGSLISNMFTPYGWLPSKIAFASVGILCCGVSGALLIGVFLDTTSNVWDKITRLIFCYCRVSCSHDGDWLVHHSHSCYTKQETCHEKETTSTRESETVSFSKWGA